MHVIEFSPPMSGFDGEFNTFRLGLKLSKILKVGDTIALIDKPKALIFGKAEVVGLDVGRLGEMADVHARFNHNQKGLDVEGAASRLVDNMVKRYGPHKCDSTKKVSVVYLRRIE